MSTVLHVRASWPSPLCKRVARGEHAWQPELEGVECVHCGEVMPWVDCQSYQAWCGYLMLSFMQLERLN